MLQRLMGLDMELTETFGEQTKQPHTKQSGILNYSKTKQSHESRQNSPRQISPYLTKLTICTPINKGTISVIHIILLH